jgi:two-component system, chemotaxis family, sensor kinase CheA
LDRSELIKRLLAIFLVELQDHLRVFNQELLALEQRASDHNAAESIHTLFRTVHSLKGAARSVDASRLANVCHELETILAPLREGDAVLSPELFTLLFEAADALAAAGKELQGGAGDGSHAVFQGLERRLAAFGHTIASSRPPPLAAVASPPTAPVPRAPTLLPDSRMLPSLSPPTPPTPAPTAAPAASEQQPPAAAASSAKTMSFALAGSGAAVVQNDNQVDEHASVRVPVRRLDALLWRSGELSVARRRFEGRRDEIVAIHEAVTHLRGRLRGSERPARNGQPKPDAVSGKAQRLWQSASEALERIENDLSKLTAAVSDDVRGLERAAAPLELEVHKVRLLSFGEACEGLQRTVRDLTKAAGKDIELQIEGAALELDRAIIEGARSALLQLVRNAVDHGLEAPADRLARGKPPRGKLWVRAAVRGDRVEVSVSDDGRGIDLAALRAQAQRRGLDTPDDERELVALIFRPGFSTARIVTDVSGRGVGLDVVCTQIESLRGELDVEFEAGQGTTFRMRLPLTASSLRGLLVQAGEQLFALPNSCVQALVRAGADNIARREGREVLLTPNGPVPLCSLCEVLGVVAGEPSAPASKLLVVVVAADGRSVGISVDRWLTEQELVLKPLGRRVCRLRHVSAAAMLPTGRVTLVLKPHELVRSALGLRSQRALGQLFAPKQTVTAKRVLLCDDSVTTRTLEKSILEAAGYEVLAAPDGEQAFKLLQAHGADIVVSDVEMPNMNGFMLTEAIRGSQRFRELPVVLLTALGSEEDRARGLASGASAYLVKSSFDQENLLKTLRQLM